MGNITSGGNVSFLLAAADNRVGYLFNSYKYGRGNEPCLIVVATPLLTILSGMFTNGGFQLAGIGGDNGVYNVQVSTNLATTNWLTIGTVTASTNGTIRFDDTNAIVPQRFYRLSQ